MLAVEIHTDTCISIALIPVYFKRRRGLALGLATGGGSIGGVIYPIIFRRLVVEVGFGWAVRVLGFIALVTLGTAVGLSKPIGVRIQRKLLEPSAFRDKAYVMFLFSAFCKSVWSSEDGKHCLANSS